MTIRMTASRIRTATPEDAETILRKFILATIKKITSKIPVIYPQDHRLYNPIERDSAKGASVQILEALRRGPCTNQQLSHITLRYGGRLHDLRHAGYDIRTERIAPRLYSYELVL